MRACLVTLLVCTTLAHAGPHQVLVLRAEGTADTPTRTNVETHVLRLARNIEGKVEAGDINYADAAAAAGCNPADAGCKDEILMTFAVDELVATTVLTSNGQHTVMVRRMKKGAAPRVATSELIAGAVMEGRLQADLGPLFGIGTAPATAPTPAVPAVTEAKKPPVVESRPPPAAAVASTQSSPTSPVVETQTAPTPAELPASEPAPAATATTPIAPQTDTTPPDRRAQKIGFVVGGALVVLGIVMWGAAASTQGDIDAAPADTPADFVALRDLESKADAQAGVGNLMVIGGVVVAGISGYYYWKKGKQAHARTARVTPAVFPHGGGLVLTFGGGR